MAKLTDSESKELAAERIVLGGKAPDPEYHYSLYEAAEGAPDELAVVCANCSYPVIQEFDSDGNFVGMREELGPKDEEQALEQGWTDSGLGLYCPKCSEGLLKDQAEDLAEGASTGAASSIMEIVDTQVLRALAPTVSDDTIQQFVKMFESERLVLAGMADEVFSPVPKDETQAQEFLLLSEALKAAKESA